ncbi:helix-turn-helix transcriptional regulator [Nostoc sp. FACHB-888]|uniref:helix-turn-helix domain-containing protein n=1 Tax=Nostoc sp. FACHB-888 TaxID=2692842 RepID=UPI0016828C9C|nr:helix-turn-helix transcriptional regulator [Nostoc sp. FACHB-888]MBD2242159.1 helix-turn-helix transcriptional regulator [Nostoc sp. FACHB-888]MCC5652227.1 helix-turn-helix domain-containing protein [Nostoc sp. XA013]
MAALEDIEIAALIREARQLLQLSQVEFASKVGVSFQSVNRWENGRNRPIPLALKQVERLLHDMGEPGENLLTKYFSSQD